MISKPPTIAWSKKSFIRGKSASVISPEAKITYCHLGEDQPLVIEREPSNPKDASAVLVRDLYGQPCGYVAAEHAPEVSAKLSAGEIVLVKTIGPCLCLYRRIFLWTEAQQIEEVESRFKRKPRELELTAWPPGKDQYDRSVE